MKHNLFKPKTLQEGKHTVVGDCNGIPCEDRWSLETPLFAEAILEHAPEGSLILDYGCGVGRIAKEILKQREDVRVIGLDASADELEQARAYVNNKRFKAVLPHMLNERVDLVYSVYCLQHVPAIDLRGVIHRIHTFSMRDAKFIYCSSDYRMAIRFDGGGFMDDACLGVNIREEIGHLYKEEGDLFTGDQPDIIKKMVYGEGGGLPHPAKVYSKNDFEGHLFNADLDTETDRTPIEVITPKKEEVVPQQASGPKTSGPKKLILKNPLSPGDVLVMTTAIRALHQAYPAEFLTDVQSPTSAIFQNSPYITLLAGDPEAEVIEMQYPEIHKSGASGRHFSDGYRKFLEEKLGLKIPRVGLLPDLFLSQDEKNWPSPVFKEHGYEGQYWVLNAGSKNDYPLKQYHRWQEVVDYWNLNYPEIRIVQIGDMEHNHPSLEGVLDMRGKTLNHRDLYRLIYKSDGVFTCVSYPMHIAAALELPCVVVAGGREGTRWELYPSHRFLYTNGALECCLYDGCWKSKNDECLNFVTVNEHPNGHPNMQDPISKDGSFHDAPLCMEMIAPEEIVRAASLYYIGGALKIKEESNA